MEDFELKIKKHIDEVNCACDVMWLYGIERIIKQRLRNGD